MKEHVLKKTKILRKKEFLIILLIFFIVMISFLSLNISFSYFQKLNSNKEIVNLISETIIEDFDESLNEINEISKKVFLEEDFFEINDRTDFVNNNEEINNYLNYNFEEYRSELIRGIGFISDLDKKSVVYSGVYNDIFYKDSFHFKNMISVIKEKSITDEYKGGKMFCFYDDTATENQAIIFIRKVRDLRNDNYGEELGYGYIVVNKQALLNLFNVGKVIDGYHPFVVNDAAFRVGNEDISINEINESKYYVYYSGFTSHEYSFYGVYDKNAILNQMKAEIINELLIYILIFVLFTLAYYKIHVNNQKSFQYLVTSFENNKIHSGLDLIPFTESDEEVNKVIEVYNEMVNSYINEKNNSELLQIEKNKFEIESLYSQINKHFVINVLSIVHSLIILGDLEKANACLEDLSDYLRYNLSFNLTKAYLKDEISALTAYVNLQKYRYPLVMVEYDIDDVGNITLPKMIIQPLVENAYVHGLKSKEGLLKLIIKRKEQKLIIEVKNTADKISEDELEVLNKKIYDTTFDTIPNGNHGIALKNIRKRLEIAYPSMTNIYIKNDGEFTSSIIEIEIDEEEMTC